jgi:hypothetical protein
MTWFNLIKVDETDRVTAIILNYYDDWGDFWSKMQEGLGEFTHIIDERVMGKITKLIGILDKTKTELQNFEDNIGSDITDAHSKEEIRGGITRFTISLLENMKTNPAFQSMGFPDSFMEHLKLTEPQKLNYDRLIRRLEMGSGYEE